jgi:acyl-coenzyme A thioesterase PaaI-like protein
MGTLHGGILCDIADAAMGMAFASTLAPEVLHYRRTESQFLSPDLAGTTQSGRNRCAARRTIGYVECDITDEEDRLVAKAASTCMVLRGQKSAGR